MTVEPPPPEDRQSVYREPPPPPKLDHRKLWLSLLLPLVAAILAPLLLWAGLAQSFGGPTMLILPGLIGGWLLFANCLSVRFRGRSFVILVLLYPFVQIPIIATAFFLGCVVLLSLEA